MLCLERFHLRVLPGFTSVLVEGLSSTWMTTKTAIDQLGRGRLRRRRAAVASCASRRGLLTPPGAGRLCWLVAHGAPEATPAKLDACCGCGAGRVGFDFLLPRSETPSSTFPSSSRRVVVAYHYLRRRPEIRNRPRCEQA